MWPGMTCSNLAKRCWPGRACGRPPVPRQPGLAAATGTTGRRQSAEGRHWEVFETAKGSASLAADRRRIHRRPGKFPRAPLPRIRFLPALCAALSLRRRSLASCAADDPPGDSPMHVFRRKDIDRLRLTLRKGQAPVELRHRPSRSLLLPRPRSGPAQSGSARRRPAAGHGARHPFPFRPRLPLGLGRGRRRAAQRLPPSGWVPTARSSPAPTPGVATNTWLRLRAPQPLHFRTLGLPAAAAGAGHSDEPGDLRYRLIEYHRMPVMAYLAIDQPRTLSREDWVRIGLATTLHPDEPLPVNEPQLSSSRSATARTVSGPTTRPVRIPASSAPAMH
jgi:hypothetical protein